MQTSLDEGAERPTIPTPIRYALAIVVGAAGLGLRLSLNPLLGNDIPYVFNFLAIALSGMAIWTRPGIRGHRGAASCNGVDIS